ncbi:hypothetical protein GTO89_02655 [Heliobacterium gestii]|uniref:Uncharacterized protein n=1 Tax=Heliomicrobium gestii TaxID=2699 RepID=A0A845L9J3_HELGE|nr:hypothetical protein [Heliomicrobium gestii]MBM7865685.1 hypothetical protein [Heliomicrobium gestii]MZP41934.1 hypothetical protein [Heliomicrobium gestii]
MIADRSFLHIQPRQRKGRVAGSRVHSETRFPVSRLTRQGFIEVFGGCPSAAHSRSQATNPGSNRGDKGLVVSVGIDLCLSAANTLVMKRDETNESGGFFAPIFRVEPFPASSVT